MSFAANSSNAANAASSGGGNIPVSSSNSSLANLNTAAVGDETVAAVLARPLTDSEFAEIIEAVDDAFALLMSGTALVDSDDTKTIKALELQVNTAILTIMKMLANLQKNKGEQKFR